MHRNSAGGAVGDAATRLAASPGGGASTAILLRSPERHLEARRIVPTVLPITVEVLDSARLVLDRDERVSARDALHAAVVVTYDLRQVCSYDRDFDELEEIQRVEP